MKKYSKYLITLAIILTVLLLMSFVPISASRLIPVIEQQVTEQLGVNVHIDKLILRVGPFVKLKTPIMHIMYEDGQKFAQFDNVKFYLSWVSVLNKKPSINFVDIGNLNIRLNSDDKYLLDLLNNIAKRNIHKNPNIHVKEYKISYNNKETESVYKLCGNNLDINKLIKYDNYKVRTNGNISIDDKKYISYDLSIVPKFKPIIDFDKVNISDQFEQIKTLDFHSDIIADLKLYGESPEFIKASGFINIDNIAIMDSDTKNQKSFFYLTLLGDKASVLSNIYTSADKKVYIEGMISNSQKPSIDLKIKTDNINLSDLHKKIRMFEAFSKFKCAKQITGTMNANFSLKGDLNKIKSNGFLKIENAGIITDGLKFNNINADVDFSNNVIKIVNAVGYVNKSPVIAKGSIGKNINIELLMNKVDLKYLLPESSGIIDGQLSLNAKVGGTLDNVLHKENVQLDNLKIVQDNFDFTLESLKFDNNKNNIAYIKNIAANTKETAQIKIPSMRLNIDDDAIKIPDTNIFMQNSKSVLNGNILNYNNKDLTFSIKLDGFIHSSDINKLKTFNTHYPIKLSISGNKAIQNIIAQILVEQTNILDEPSLLNCNVKLDKDTLKLDDLSIVSFNGKFNDDFKLNLKGQKRATLTGIVENIKNPQLKNVRIYIPQPLCLHIWDTIAQIKCDLFFNGEINSPEIVGQLIAQNFVNQTAQLSIPSFSTDFNKGTALFNAPLLKIADSTMSVNSLLSTNYKNNIEIKNINIKSKYLNTDTLLMYKDNMLIKTLPLSIKEGKFYSERLASSAYGSSIYLSLFASDFSLEDNVLKLKNINAEAYNGKISGSIDFNIKDETYSSKIMARGVSAAPIFDLISNRKETISGTMDIDSSLSGNLSTKQSICGKTRFEIRNGRMSTLGKLEHLLYAQNVVADSMLRTSLSVVTRAITLKDTGLFKYLRGDIDIDKGIANIKMLQSQGPLMSLFIKGQYYIDSDYAKLTVLGRLSDEVISGLGAFGDFSLNKLMIMLTGEDNRYNIQTDDLDKLPQLSAKNTKEFRAIINGIVDKPSSVVLFNWISYSQKSLRQKDVPMTNTKVPVFIDELPY